ncbi:hypothetical protein AXF42_Ash012134 [Apostasia shenzhenica]|uniref:Uncharacterized protein n=1 Tax=Apostasia shenzhenica TaxID=1088818 RepID=A0A2I0B435_9ASPA|nr:hypothetical protein AXF42_Ash012134 [Apostasia shenzhenica]
MLKDEEFERLFPGLGGFDEGVGEPPLAVGRPTPLGAPVPASEKKRKSFLLSLPPLDLGGEEGKKEGGAKEKKEESLLTSSGTGGSGGEAEKAMKKKGEALPAVSSAPFGTEGAWSMLGDRLCEIRWAEEKILGNTSEILEVIKSLKGKEDVEARCLREVRELEGALSQATKRSLSERQEQLGKVYQMEDMLASLAQVNAEWANKSEIARGEFNCNLAGVNQAHSAHVKDLQKRIKDLDDDREALREERRRLREELTKAREVLLGAKEAAFEAYRRKELLKSEVCSLRALVENSSGWRGRRMEDLEETVRRAVKIVSASSVGRYVQNQAAFDTLLQTLVDVSTLNQENIRDPAVLPFCGPKGPDRFFDAGSRSLEEIPPPRSYAGWGRSWSP